MTTLTISVEDSSILPSLRKVLNSIQGVSILKKSAKTAKKKSGLDEAMDDIRHGRVTTYNNVEELIQALGI